MNVFRDLQGSQIWEMHGEWIRKETPVFASEIADRFALAEQLSQKDHTKAESLQKDITLRLSEQLGGDGVLVIPTVPGPAPLAGGSASTLEQNRNGALSLCCIAGLSGFPQITLPIKGPDGLPLGLSVIAASGQDLRLLSWIQEIWKTEFL
ncbi:amidase [compost metagenome]